MIFFLTYLLVSACTAIIGFKFGPVLALGFFVTWTFGLYFACKLIDDFGRPTNGSDRVATITDNQGLDFALAAIWPIGIPLILGYAIVRRIRR